MLERSAQPDRVAAGAVLGKEFGLYFRCDGQLVEGFQQKSDKVISAGRYWKGWLW